MKTPYGLRVIEECVTCPVLKDRLFCDLPRQGLQALDAISSAATYPKGAILFVEGQAPNGVFIICSGRIKLFGTAANGKSVIFRIAEAGEVVGMPSTLSDQPYEVTAEALEPIQANFVPREKFLAFLREHGDVALKVAEMLSQIYYTTCQEVRYLGLASSATEKLARFLLNLTPQPNGSGAPRATLTLTHEEIGSMMGLTRETVSRLLAKFKRQRLIEIHGSTVVLANRKGLESMVEA